jgi:hypothetical protein
LGTGDGRPVDAAGGLAYDPTENVKDQFQASERRADDLREADEKLRDAQFRHIAEVIRLRADYDEKLRLSESARIDAIRAVDVGAAAILANQVTASADALRGQVEVARQQTATALAAALDPIQTDVRQLRDAQSAFVGGTERKTDSRLSTGLLVAIVAVVLTFLGLVISSATVAIALYLALHK